MQINNRDTSKESAHTRLQETLADHRGAAEYDSDIKLPQTRDPFGEIYLNETLWYRLYETSILDKDENIYSQNCKGYFELMKDSVRPFIVININLIHMLSKTIRLSLTVR